MSDTGGWQPISGNANPASTPPSKGNSTATLVIVGVVGCFGVLMIVGILAAIAIPNFLAMQLRAKRAEAPANLAGIRVAMLSAAGSGQPFAARPSCPATAPGRSQVAWQGPCTGAWADLWEAPVAVRCQYRVDLADGGQDFVAVATCDIDGDGTASVYVTNKELAPTMETPNNVY